MGNEEQRETQPLAARIEADITWEEGRGGGGREEGKGLLHIRAHVFREILNGAQERNWGSQVALRLKAKPALSPS